MRGAVTYAQANESKLYRQIKGAQVICDVNQTELGKVIGVTQQGMSHLLKTQSLDVSQLCRIADRFGLEVRLCDRQS